jgi:transglutaminase superfamily protein
VKKTLFALLGLGAALAIPSGAAATGGSHHRNPQVARLNREVETLRHRLRSMTAARAQVKAALASAQGQLSSLQGEAASLQGTVAQRTSERDAARSQAASLQAQIAAIPTPVVAAEQEISREIWEAEREAPSRPVGEIVSLAVTNYVAENVSFLTRGYFIAHGWPVSGEDTPANTNVILDTHVGECGQHAIAFATLMRHFGYPVRSVQFWYDDPPGSPNGHIADEVYYDGSWHYFDSSLDLYWTDTPDGNVLSISNMRANGGVQHMGVLLFDTMLDYDDPGAIAHSNDITWFETDPTTNVVLGAVPMNG